MSNKKSDFKHKIAHFYTTEYDVVCVEDLSVKGMFEGDRSARNMAEVGWRDFISVLEHHGRKNGCYVVGVSPRDTTKECYQCGVKTEKPLWVREHSCPSCGFEVDRDLNASWNVLDRGLEKLGVVHSDGMPVETGISVDADSTLELVSASSVVESGSPVLKEAVSTAQ